jgi:hypothetical protein
VWKNALLLHPLQYTVCYDLSCAELSWAALSLERDLFSSPLLWKKRRFFFFISPLVFLTASLVLLTHRAILTRHDRQHWLLFIYFFFLLIPLLLLLFIDPFLICERANSDVAFLQN